jgi:hypothetical protein
MSDIVERLRMVARIEGEPALRDAADEIERLRAEVEKTHVQLAREMRARDDALTLIAEALAVTDRAKSDDASRADVRRILSRAPVGAADRIRAEQREEDSRIVERVPVGRGLEPVRVLFAAAIRGGDPRGE